MSMSEDVAVRAIVWGIATVICILILTIGGCVGMNHYLAAVNYRDAVEHGQDPQKMACAHQMTDWGAGSNAATTSVCMQLAVQSAKPRE